MITLPIGLRRGYESGDRRVKVLAAEAGVTVAQFERAAYQAGWRRPKRPKHWLPLERLLVRQRYENGERVATIAADTQRVVSSIYGAASRGGWKRPTQADGATS